MITNILSLNVGGPAHEEWNGRRIHTSMLKRPVPRLEVGPLSIEGDSFANPKAHGTPDSVLYIFGLKSLLAYMALLGRDSYEPGSLGENILTGEFDEHEVSVGDVFRIGAVVAQATFPRIPCAKVDVRMQHADGRNAMVECGRSGVYMRVLEPGVILPSDRVERVEQAAVRFTIFDVYAKAANGVPLTEGERERALANGAFPERMIAKWTSQ